MIICNRGLFFFILIGIICSGLIAQSSSIEHLEAKLNVGNEDEQFEVAMQIAKIYRDTFFDYQSEYQYLLKAIDIAENNNPKGLANVQRRLGANYVNRSLYDSSLIAYYDAKLYYESVGDTMNLLYIQELEANVFQQQNKIPEALSVYHDLIIQYEAMNSFDGIYNSRLVRINVAYIEIIQNDYQSAIDYLLPCFEPIDKFKPTPKQSATMEGLSVNYNLFAGQAYEKLGNLKIAYPYFQKCLETSKKIDYPHTEGYALLGIGNYFLNELGDDVQAEIEFQKALEVIEEIGSDADGLIKAHNHLSHVYNHLNNYRLAKYHATKSIEIAEDIRQFEGIEMGHHELAVAYESQGDYKHAFDHLTKATIANDSLINLETIKEIQSLQAEYQAEIKDLKITSLEKEKALTDKQKRLQLGLFIAGLLAVFGGAYFFLSRQKLNQAKAATKYEKQISRALNKFVPKSFLKTIGRDHILDVQLGDQVEQEVTVIFTDIRSFTTLSEGMSVSENFKFVKRYAEKMGPIIVKHGGFINQYLGDGIMAIFQSSPEDALKACIEMQKTIGIMNGATKLPIRVGMGIHTGLLVMGIIGDETRQDAALISDAVNTAARLEALTKDYGASIILSQASYNKIENQSKYHFRFLGKNKVKGKNQPINIFECLPSEIPSSEFKIKLLDTFNAAVKSYESCAMEDAKLGFKRITKLNQNDMAAQYFLQSIEQSEEI